MGGSSGLQEWLELVELALSPAAKLCRAYVDEEDKERGVFGMECMEEGALFEQLTALEPRCVMLECCTPGYGSHLERELGLPLKLKV